MPRSLMIIALAVVPMFASACSSGGGSPSTSPTSNPAPKANPPTVAPASLAFGAPSAPAQTITVAESAYVGAFRETDTCAGIATIAAPPSVSGPTVKYTISPRAAGTCAVNVADSNAQQLTIGVTITATTFPVQ